MRWFVLTHVNSFAFIDGHGLWAVETISTLGKDDVDKLVAAVAVAIPKPLGLVIAYTGPRDCLAVD
jgi:hypothetical protein